MKIYLSFFILISTLFGVEFKVATYNVENFFDLHYDGTEYKEYRPNSKLWNKKAYYNKLKNITKVIKDLKSDIIALQEIESPLVLKDIQKNTNYKYSAFLKKSTSSVGVALLSNYPIIKKEKITISRYNPHSRPILKATLLIDDKKLIIYINHWRSKRAKESKRIKYALALKKDIDKLNDTIDYIILGDLNSNYDEWQTFKHNKKLNNSYGITAINQILNTTIDNRFITKQNIKLFNQKVHYNLWLELPKKDRFSTIFKKQKNTPDNIIVSKSLFDNKNISYVDKSFKAFTPKYLFRSGKVYRWYQRSYRGFSDHLPIYALFSTTKQTYSINQTNQKISTIDHLYNITYLKEPIELKDVVVLYSSKKHTIIKQPNHRAITIYNAQYNFKVGFSYNVVVNSIDDYFGLQEIKKITFITKNNFYKNYKKMYIKDINKIDKNHINDIVTNIKGIYKNRYLYLNNGKRVKLFLAKGVKKIANNSNIILNYAHITTYKGNIQLTIYKNSDYKLNKP